MTNIMVILDIRRHTKEYFMATASVLHAFSFRGPHNEAEVELYYKPFLMCFCLVSGISVYGLMRKPTLTFLHPMKTSVFDTLIGSSV